MKNFCKAEMLLFSMVIASLKISLNMTDICQGQTFFYELVYFVLQGRKRGQKQTVNI
jgi:hypothetical protein